MAQKCVFLFETGGSDEGFGNGGSGQACKTGEARYRHVAIAWCERLTAAEMIRFGIGIGIRNYGCTCRVWQVLSKQMSDVSVFPVDEIIKVNDVIFDAEVSFFD